MLQEETIRTRDGQQIGLSIFRPEGDPPDRVVLIGPGAGMEQSFYKPIALFLVSHGMAAVTFDYRGTGRSRHGRLRHFRATLKQWGTHDLDAVLLYVKKEFPRQELIMLGHCLSGEIAGIAPASENIDRMILVNSALSCWRLWPRSSQPKIMLMKMLAPVVSSLYGYYPGNTLHFMRDMPKGVVTEFSNWCNLPNGLFDLFPDNNYRKLSIPILAYSFADDWFSPVKAVSALLEHFKNARIRWLHLQPSEVGKSAIGHDGFFEPGNESLWQDMIDWIGKPEPAKGYFY